MSRAELKYPAQFGIVFAAYFAAGRLGLSTPFTNGNVSPVWPASGIALAAVLLCGYRIWPAILAGAFLVNFFSAIPHIAALSLATGNTLAALRGGFFFDGCPGFKIRYRDWVTFWRSFYWALLPAGWLAPVWALSFCLPHMYVHGLMSDQRGSFIGLVTVWES